MFNACILMKFKLGIYFSDVFGVTFWAYKNITKFWQNILDFAIRRKNKTMKYEICSLYYNMFIFYNICFLMIFDFDFLVFK